MKLNSNHIYNYSATKVKSLCLLVCSILFSSGLFSQTQIDRSVISSSGQIDSTSNLKISATVGEAVIQTFSSSNGSLVLTQGFQQSFDGAEITFNITITNSSCNGQNNGFAVISNIVGCNDPYTITWSNGNMGLRATSLSAGNYTVQVSSDDGCNEMLPFTVGSTNASCLLKFYSGITPNGDGRNETWIIDNIDLYPTNKVEFYNRLGNKVWEGTNYNNSTTVWGGENLSGNELPSDTYFYIFEAEGEVEKGWVELTR